MDGIDEPAKNEQRSGGIGPGERLQAARIQKGLSLDDVASRMHLSVNILKAIENNQFEEITAPIFVKGYLRAYARIVSLDEDDMIDQYVDFYSDEDPPIIATSNTASELSAADPRIKGTTFIVVLIIGVSLATWWWNREQSDEMPISLDTQTSSIEEPAESDTDVVASEIEAVSETLIESGETDAASTSEVSVATTEVETINTATEQEAPAAEVETTATAEQETPAAEVEIIEAETDQVAEVVAVVDEQDQVVEVEVVETEVEGDAVVAAQSGALETERGTRNVPGLIAPGGTDKLTIIVNADTWADIKDATSYQLVYDLLRADRSVELIGEAPFTVFLGNGYGVEIMFNGEEIDVAPRIRNDNTARLKIGG